MSPTPNTNRCEHCGRPKPVMLTVDPPRGSESPPLRLCSTCYLEGIRPMDYVEPERPAQTEQTAPATAPEPAAREPEPATGKKAKKPAKARKAG